MSKITDALVRLTMAWALGTALLASTSPSQGAPPNTIGGSAAVCDPWSPQNCAKPDASGAIPVTVSGSTGSSDVNINGINGAPPSSTNPLWVAPAGSALFPIISPTRSALTVAGCSVGVASALCLAASTANLWVQVQNTSATASVACSWGGTATLNASNSFLLAPGQSASWGVMSSGVPTNALNCIASAAATPLYVEYR
jgi:hypothetical protein